jgi:hypothetical protein
MEVLKKQYSLFLKSDIALENKIRSIEKTI